MIQYLIVGLLVAAAMLYSVWILMPAAWRRTSAARLAAQAARSGLDPHAARELQTRLERASSCGSCESCKGCGSVKPRE
jgi:hypothetical protein